MLNKEDLLLTSSLLSNMAVYSRKPRLAWAVSMDMNSLLYRTTYCNGSLDEEAYAILKRAEKSGDFTTASEEFKVLYNKRVRAEETETIVLSDGTEKVVVQRKRDAK